MNAKLLIDSVIRQTTVLVAHLATSAGLRAPLAHIANAVFLDLSEELSSQGVSRKEVEGDPVFTSEVCVIPMRDPAGWETAFFDHFNAVVTAACAKLRNARLRSLPSDVVGGSTYSFEIWTQHPFAERVLGLLRDTRRELSALREEVDQYNEKHKSGGEDVSKVTFYFGQSVIGEEPPTNTSNE